MAYNRRKITIYGGAAVITATFIILAFLWSPFEEVGLVPIVELESVMPGTLAITIITDNSDISVERLMLTVDRLQIKLKDGDWDEAEIPGGSYSFDLLNRQDTIIDDITGQLEDGSMIRMHIVQPFGKIEQPVSQYSNATLNNGDVVDVVLPSEDIELLTPITITLRVYVEKS